MEKRGEIALLDIPNMGGLKRRLEFLSYLLNRAERVSCYGPHEDVDTAAEAAANAPWGPRAGMIRNV
jgi:hypothetical protein